MIKRSLGLLITPFCPCDVIYCICLILISERNAVSDSHKTKEPQISINITMGTPIPPIPRPSGKVRKSPKFICPDENVSRPFFSIPCKTTKECSQSGNKNMVCCNNRCLKGVPAPPPEPVHSRKFMSHNYHLIIFLNNYSTVI